MQRKIHEINILPAKYISKLEDNHLIKILLSDNVIEERIFNKYACEGIDNPNLLFIGIITGVGFLQINVCDANEFEDLFKKKWKILLK